MQYLTVIAAGASTDLVSVWSRGDAWGMTDFLERPGPRPVGSSRTAAVEFCREWMVFLGERDTVIAEGAAAAVCDLYGSRYVALVDNRRGNIDVPLVQRAIALTESDGRRALVFHPGGCLLDAADLATDHGIALIMFDPRSGTIEARNQLAVPICRSYRLP